MSSPARIVIAGATGFLGAPLARAFADAGAHVTVLTRRPDAAIDPRIRARTWTPDGSAGPWAAAIDGADAVINLAGESLASGRWTAARKARLVDSRVLATRSIVSAITAAIKPPAALISASGIGYYGPRGDEVVSEDTPPGSDFIARLAVAWEAEAERAAGAPTRVVFARTSLVVAADGGALASMLPPFKAGVGGRIGSGRQYWAWIHRDDWVTMIMWAASRNGISGGLNVTAPNPVTNADFARALGRALHRRAVLPTPAYLLRLAFGEMADALMLSGQRAIPEKAARHGFRFRYERIDDALAALFSTPPAAAARP